jgi:hypothetical protein
VTLGKWCGKQQCDPSKPNWDWRAEQSTFDEHYNTKCRAGWGENLK